MAYFPPIFKVYQAIQSQTPISINPVLEGCIVGPAYQVLKFINDRELTKMGDYSGIELTDDIPNKKVGAVVEESSVNVYAGNPTVIVSGSSASAEFSKDVIAEANIIDAAGETFIADGVLANQDILIQRTGDEDLIAKVIEVVSETQLKISKSVTYNTATEISNETGTGVAIIGDETITDMGADFVTDAVAIGDRITVSSGANSFVSTVATITDLNNIEMADQCDFAAVDADILIERIAAADIKITHDLSGDVQLDAADFSVDTVLSQITVNASVAITLPVSENIAGSKIIDSSELYAEFRALRTDLTDPVRIANADDVSAVLEDVTDENPLGLAASLAMAASNKAIYIVGVQSDDLLGYTKAKNALEFNETIYAIAVLTDEASIAGIFKSHVLDMSSPEKSKWRIAAFGMKLVEDKDLYDSEGNVTHNIEAINAENVLLNIPGETFITSDMKPGDDIYYTIDGGSETMHIIEEVLSEEVLKVTTATAFAADGSDLLGDIRVNRILTLDEQADQSGAMASSFNSERCIAVWPPVIGVTIDGESKDVPGYYAAASIVAAVISVAPQVGISKLGLPGIDYVKYSKEYFTFEQLNVIAGHGVTILMQDSPTQLPYIRHQLTTNPESNELREISHVKNRDYVAIRLRDAIKPLWNNGNVVPEVMDAISLAANVEINRMKREVVYKYGPVLVAGSVGSVAPEEGRKDSIVIYVSGLQIPNVFNDLTLYINFD